MASPYTPPVQILIDELGRLPGIGPRSAQRLALHLIKSDDEDVARGMLAVSAQRYVDVVAKESAQRDVPPAPEVACRFR